MPYQVKEIYYTLQGEGVNAGRAAVFCRFAGCNLWNGRKADQSKAVCWFCDTDFVGTDGSGGGSFSTADSLALAILEKWPNAGNRPSDKAGRRFVVFTGGEPLLQLNQELVEAAKNLGFECAVETNGTLKAPLGLDWITVSPKPGAPLVQTSGSELKLVYPQEVLPESVQHLKFEHFLLSPRTTGDAEETLRHTQMALEYCRTNPQWRLTLQYHKIWGIP